MTATSAPLLVAARNVTTARVNGIDPGAVGFVDARLVEHFPDHLERVEVCGARLRSGATCAREPLAGARRCRAHGGASTGPKTAAGRLRVAEAMRSRWALSRRAVALSHAGRLPEGPNR